MLTASSYETANIFDHLQCGSARKIFGCWVLVFARDNYIGEQIHGPFEGDTQPIRARAKFSVVVFFLFSSRVFDSSSLAAASWAHSFWQLSFVRLGFFKFNVYLSLRLHVQVISYFDLELVVSRLSNSHVRGPSSGGEPEGTYVVLFASSRPGVCFDVVSLTASRLHDFTVNPLIPLLIYPLHATRLYQYLFGYPTVLLDTLPACCLSTKESLRD